MLNSPHPNPLPQVGEGRVFVLRPHPSPLPQVCEGRVFVLRPHPNPYLVKTKIEPTIITIVPIIFFVISFSWNILNPKNSDTNVDNWNNASAKPTFILSNT